MLTGEAGAGERVLNSYALGFAAASRAPRATGPGILQEPPSIEPFPPSIFFPSFSGARSDRSLPKLRSDRSKSVRLSLKLRRYCFYAADGFRPAQNRKIARVGPFVIKGIRPCVYIVHCRYFPLSFRGARRGVGPSSGRLTTCSTASVAGSASPLETKYVGWWPAGDSWPLANINAWKRRGAATKQVDYTILGRRLVVGEGGWIPA